MAVNVRLSSSQAESAKRQRVLENRIVLQEIKSWHGDGKTVSENSELSLNIIHETKIGISRSQEIIHVVIFNLTRQKKGENVNSQLDVSFSDLCHINHQIYKFFSEQCDLGRSFR